jgi:eukaryotic-like serine/threonine-protein kinase
MRLNRAWQEAEFGHFQRAREDAVPAMNRMPGRFVQALGALVLVRAGDNTRAQSIADGLGRRYSGDTVLNRYWLPTIRAAIAINRKNPARALGHLQVASHSELGLTAPFVEQAALLVPVYVRGQAFLLLRQGKEAAAEFQKFFDYRGATANCPLAALAHLQLGRAYAMSGDTSRARAAYQDFFALWKDADPNIPILQQAKAEYAKLK